MASSTDGAAGGRPPERRPNFLIFVTDQNRRDDPGSQALKRDLQALLLERLALTDSVLPRRLCHA